MTEVEMMTLGQLAEMEEWDAVDKLDDIREAFYQLLPLARRALEQECELLDIAESTRGDWTSRTEAGGKAMLRVSALLDRLEALEQEASCCRVNRDGLTCNCDADPDGLTIANAGTIADVEERRRVKELERRDWDVRALDAWADQNPARNWQCTSGWSRVLATEFKHRTKETRGPS